MTGWILLIVHLLSFIFTMTFIVKDYRNGDGDFEGLGVLTICSLTPILSQIGVIIITHELIKDRLSDNKNNHIIYNKIYKCSSCGLYSRKAYIKLHNLNTGKDECPNCESERTMSATNLDIDTELPLSPIFTAKQIKELEKMESDKEKNKLIDDQLEKYLALQEKKLSKTYDEALSKLNDLKQNKL